MVLMNRISSEDAAQWRKAMLGQQSKRHFGTCKATTEANMKSVMNAYGEQRDACRKAMGLPEYGNGKWEQLCNNTPHLRDFNDISMELGLAPRFLMSCMFDYYRFWSKRSNGPPNAHLGDIKKIRYAVTQVTGLPPNLMGNLFDVYWLKDKATKSFNSAYAAIHEILHQTGNAQGSTMGQVMDIDTLGLCACHKFCCKPELYKQDPYRKDILEGIQEELADDRMLRTWMHDLGWTFDRIVDYLKS